jgi:hypothetical protein
VASNKIKDLTPSRRRIALGSVVANIWRGFPGSRARERVSAAPCACLRHKPETFSEAQLRLRAARTRSGRPAKLAGSGTISTVASATRRNGNSGRPFNACRNGTLALDLIHTAYPVGAGANRRCVERAATDL